jgi:monoamine oxidase
VRGYPQTSQGADIRRVVPIKGGNQRMTDAFAARLGPGMRLGCPVTKIVRGDSAVTVHYQEFGEDKSIEAEYLVNAIPLPLLKRIPVEPSAGSQGLGD